MRRVASGVATLVLLAGCSGHRGASTSPTSSAHAANSLPTSHTVTSSPTSSPAVTHSPARGAVSTVPRFAHVVIVVLENHAYSEIVGRSDAPFLNQLATSGAVLTNSYAITHPSEPNYLALFSGSTQGVTDDSCGHSFDTPNLGSALIAAGFTFTGYSEDLPSAGSTTCSSGSYARKHNPWADFPAVPAQHNQPMTAFPSDYSQLPTVSFVIPNLEHDMHDGSVAEADTWLRSNLGGYADWAPRNNSLLIVTTDEDDHSENNRITTLFDGARVRPGQYATRIDHYGVLRTLLDSYGITPFGNATSAPPLVGIWSH